MYKIRAFLRLRVNFYLCIMGYSQEIKMAIAWRIVSLHALMWVVILVISQLNQTNLSFIEMTLQGGSI